MILCTPTQLHASQAIACLKAGKHVQVEIPIADSLADAEEVARTQQATGMIAMVGHTRRFNPSHQWVHGKIAAGDLSVQQMDVQTYFFRRTNINALGQPRCWTDHLLWHHACPHRRSLRLADGRDRGGERPAGPDPSAARHRHGHVDPAEEPRRAPSAPCRCRSTTMARSAPSSATSATTAPIIARYDDLVDGKDNKIDVSKVDVSMNGIELQDREFFAAIRGDREPNASVAQVLPCYRVLDRLERQLAAAR